MKYLPLLLALSIYLLFPSGALGRRIFGHRRRKEGRRADFLYDDGHPEQQTAARCLQQEISVYPRRSRPPRRHRDGQSNPHRGASRRESIRRGGRYLAVADTHARAQSDRALHFAGVCQSLRRSLRCERFLVDGLSQHAGARLQYQSNRAQRFAENLRRPAQTAIQAKIHHRHRKP